MPTRIPMVGPQIPLRELRKAYGLTLNDLAERISQCYHRRPSEGTLANVELGHQVGSRKLMTAWAMALQMPPQAILQDSDLRAVLAAGHGRRRDQDGAAA